MSVMDLEEQLRVEFSLAYVNVKILGSGPAVLPTYLIAT